MDEVCCFIIKWGTVIGLGLDILGAYFVYLGIKINNKEAIKLEEIKMPVTIGDIGSPENETSNQELSQNRANERIKANKWAKLGLFFFVMGFLFQGISNWPGN